jgi:hypothetical protein
VETRKNGVREKKERLGERARGFIDSRSALAARFLGGHARQVAAPEVRAFMVVVMVRDVSPGNIVRTTKLRIHLVLSPEKTRHRDSQHHPVAESVSGVAHICPLEVNFLSTLSHAFSPS